MIKFSPVIRGATDLTRRLKSEGRRQEKALETAIKVEGFRLRKTLARQIRQGDPGGAEFAPLSMIQRKRARRKKPLAPLAKAVRYHIERDRGGLVMHIGWTGPRVSKSWKRIAEKQQEGFERDIKPALRRYLVGYGGEMGRSKFRPYFFLRRATRTFQTPARPIMEPFWDQQERRSRRNITLNFRKKLRGERI